MNELDPIKPKTAIETYQHNFLGMYHPQDVIH